MNALRHVPNDALILGFDFSTGSVKCIAFTKDGVAQDAVHLPNDLYTAGGVSELNLFQLEGLAWSAVRTLASVQAIRHGSLPNWAAAGISATHHTSGRVDHFGNQVRRAICWNDQTLTPYHALGIERLGGLDAVRYLIGGPWAERYSLSHLVKDEAVLPPADWKRTKWILSHGSLAAAALTGEYGVTSVSSAASTGLMDLRTNSWRPEMLDAIAQPELRAQALRCLPRIAAMDEPVGSLCEDLFIQTSLGQDQQPLIFPTLDDQAAGLVGGGATDAGHVAIILGNSAVVNSSADFIPENTSLDVMKLNWGPYLWMRCYSNGAQFLDPIVGAKPDWTKLEAEARKVLAGCGGFSVLPFSLSEPSLGISSPSVVWSPSEPASIGVKVRAAFEAIAYLIALAVREHEAAGQVITRVSVSGGIAKSDLMLEILASVINRPLERLESDEGPALGAAVAALWGLESYRRKQAGETDAYTIADAVRQMVRFKTPVPPRSEWVPQYAQGLQLFQREIGSLRWC